MIKWIIALGALIAALGAMVWQLSGKSEAPEVEVPTFDAGLPAETPKIIAKRRTKEPSTAPIDASAAPTEGILDPKSEEFSSQLDVGIPDKFRASLARCNRKNFDPDAKISLSYRLHIKSGVVSASNVQVESSDLGDPELEKCMVQAVEYARWEAPDLPDYTEDQDMFIRIRSLDKYLSKDEQEANKAEARQED